MIRPAAIIIQHLSHHPLSRQQVQESTQINPINLLVSMLKIIAASSLSHSIEKHLAADQENLNKIVHANPGLNLNPNLVKPEQKVFNYLPSSDLEKKKIILWHDLINNTIWPQYKTNRNNPVVVKDLLAALQKY